MSSAMSQAEDAVFQSVLPRLEAEGFRVVLHPPRAMLPSFLASFQPDAVAYKGDRKIAIEVVSDLAHGAAKERLLLELFAEHPDWELRVFYAPSRGADDVIPIASKEAIESALGQVDGSIDGIGPEAALLTGWAAFEAAARRLIPDDLGRAQTPTRLVETLASEGYVTPDEADILRQLAKIRNDVAHGRLDLKPEREKVRNLLSITRSLLIIQS